MSHGVGFGSHIHVYHLREVEIGGDVYGDLGAGLRRGLYDWSTP